MPEMLTKYPDVALKLLKDAKIPCGTGAKQLILTTCPKDQFCALPTGEFCIYGIKQVPQMTQLGPLDVFLVPHYVFPFGALAVMIFLAGLIMGITLKRR